MLRQVDRIRTATIPDSELAAVKGFLVGSFPLTIETPSQIASQVANAKLLGLGDDYLRLYRERLSAITALQAKVAAARLYRRTALTVVVVGDAARIYDRLTAIAPVRLVDPDGTPLTPSDLAAQAGPVALDAAQFAPHTDSSQVLLQGKAVGYTVAEVRRSSDSLLYLERSNLGNGQFQQQTTVVLDPADGSVRRVEQLSVQAGQRAETHLRYTGGRVTGQSAAPQQDGSVRRYEIDTVFTAPVIDENAVPFVVPALPLAGGKSF